MSDSALNASAILTGNRVLNAALLACFIAQFLKPLLSLLSDRKFLWRRLFETGGMPSSHTALVVALATSIGRIYGIVSPLFAISVCFALIVMQDAFGVRRQAGEHAKMINYFIENWGKNDPKLVQERLKELLGHTPLQVFFGALLGFVIGLLPL